MEKAELLTGERTQLRNLIRRKIPEGEKEDAKERIAEIGEELKVLRKEIRLTAVSYTHLDVYKRQFLNRTGHIRYTEN